MSQGNPTSSQRSLAERIASFRAWPETDRSRHGESNPQPTQAVDSQAELLANQAIPSGNQAVPSEDQAGPSGHQDTPSSSVIQIFRSARPKDTGPKPRSRAQNTADMPRIQYPSEDVHLREMYHPFEQDKWWSPCFWSEYVRKQSRYRHACRIMETVLGEQVFGADRCEYCRDYGLECWRYNESQVSGNIQAGKSCARCRLRTNYGCSFVATQTERER